MANQRPNVLLITSDQQHWDTLGVRNPKIKTPALDRLAKEGAYFKRAYCSNPVCSPSRASIITGLYPSAHHCWTIGVKLPEDVPTVGDIFQENGYRSILVGKAHFHPTKSAPGSESIETMEKARDLDFWRGFHGPWYGFDHFETGRMHADEPLAGQHYAVWMEDKGFTQWKDYYRKFPVDPEETYARMHSWDIPEEFHYNTWTSERTIANMEESLKQEKPFFIWSSFSDPHPKYLVPEPWASMYDPENMEPGSYTEGEFDRMPPYFAETQKSEPDYSPYKEEWHSHGLVGPHENDKEKMKKNMATYYGMVSFMDHHIGRILDALDRLGQAENTLVVFTTDHGHFLGQHGLTAKGPFHYEDMVKIPMLARFPGKIPAGSVLSSLQSQVDFAPTFLSACGIEIPGLMQGVDQMSNWTGKAEKARDHVMVENRHQPRVMHLRTYIDERYKMTIHRNHEYGEMFDLKDDPNEMRNLWDDPAYADIKARVMHRFLNAELEREPTRMPRIAGA